MAQPAAAPTTRAEWPPSVEDFAELPFIEGAQISPSGNYIAGLLGFEGKRVVAILRIAEMTDHPVLIGIADGMEADSVSWVSDDHVLLSVRGLQPVQGHQWYVSRLLAINRLTGKQTRLLAKMQGQDAADVVWIPQDGSTEILVAAQNSIFVNDEFWPALYRVDVASGKSQKVQFGRKDIMWWSADGAGRLRAGYGFSDSRQLSTLHYRGEGEVGELRVIDRADASRREGLVSPLIFYPGSDRALVLREGDDGRSGIYETDMASLREFKPFYLPPPGKRIDSTVTSADGGSLLGVRIGGIEPTMHWLQPELAALQASLDAAAPGRRVQMISFSRDRSRILVSVSRGNSAGALYFYDTRAGELLLLANLSQKLGHRPLSTVKSVRYTARDGTEIEAILTLPRGREEKNLPVILLPHGGPWAQDRLGYDYWAQFIASRGYAVLQPNFRGSTGYGDAFVAKGEGQMGLAMQDDITDGLRWLTQQGIADPARACIVGASYGGYAAMWGIAKDPDLYQCAISIAGVANLRREVNDFAGSLFERKYRADWQRMTPDFDAVSPIKAIDRIKVPLLLIHGKMDITVGHGQSSLMHARMRDAGKQVEFVSLPKADHYFTRQADRIELLRSIEAFLIKHNPPDPIGAKPQD